MFLVNIPQESSNQAWSINRIYIIVYVQDLKFQTVLVMQALLKIFTETVDEALAVYLGNYMLHYRLS